MNEQISALTSEQAQKTLLIFYDLVPNSMWANGMKLSPRDVEAMADEIQEEAPADVQSMLNVLLSGKDSEIKRIASKNLLREFYEYRDLQPYIQEAMSRAKEPTMAPIPLLIGAYIIAMAAMSFSGSTFDYEKIKSDPSGDKKIKVHLCFDPEKALKQFGNIKGIIKLLGWGVT